MRSPKDEKRKITTVAIVGRNDLPKRQRPSCTEGNTIKGGRYLNVNSVKLFVLLCDLAVHVNGHVSEVANHSTDSTKVLFHLVLASIVRNPSDTASNTSYADTAHCKMKTEIGQNKLKILLVTSKGSKQNNKIFVHPFINLFIRS